MKFEGERCDSSFPSKSWMGSVTPLIWSDVWFDQKDRTDWNEDRICVYSMINTPFFLCPPSHLIPYSLYSDLSDSEHMQDSPSSFENSTKCFIITFLMWLLFWFMEGKGIVILYLCITQCYPATDFLMMIILPVFSIGISVIHVLSDQ